MPSILVIDDDQQVCGVLREAFEVAGYQVNIAGDGHEGTAQYRAAPSDLVILDMLMPGKEGFETIRELRRDFPSIKIIAISGGGEHLHVNLLDLAKQVGANHTLKKPFKMQELLELAASMLTESST
ncbi:MAG: response regulator [Nitrospirales bacterium]|nr:MAG: response regulator [Nitrospirales bacterium]